jgi:hypothetical protein
MITPDRISSGDSASTSLDRDNPVTVTDSNNVRYEARLMFALVVLLIICGSLYLALMRPYSFGSYHDDGMYGVLGKSLATGQGYRVISLPSEPYQTKSPPLYPFLLSLIWRFIPTFPQNVPMLMLLSVMASIIFFAIAAKFLVRYSYANSLQCLIVIAIAALNWRTILLSTGVYSEMIYALLSVLALILAERQAREEAGLSVSVGLGAVMGLAFLTRSSAIALPIAVVFYFLVRSQLRRMLIPLTVCGLFITAWIVWGYFHRPPVDSVNAGYYESYFSTLGHVLGGSHGRSISSILSSLLGLIVTNAIGLIVVTVPVICLGLNYGTQSVPGFVIIAGVGLAAMTLIFTIGGFFRFRETGLRLLHAYVAAYILIHLVWPYAAYDRFLMPLLPWFLLFLVTETSRVFSSARKNLELSSDLKKKLIPALIGFVLLLLFSLVTYNIVMGIRTLHSSQKEKIRFAADQEAIRWLTANASPSDVVVCYRDPTFYLYTGLKTIRSISAREGGLTQESAESPEEQVRMVVQLIKESNARYFVATATDYEQEDQAELKREALKVLIGERPDQFVPVFESIDGRARIYRIDPMI